MCIFVPFLSTYRCEARYSALSVIKTKHPNRLNVESDLCCAVSSKELRISNLVANMQHHCPTDNVLGELRCEFGSYIL
jgi:hypothetical protein